MKKITFLLLFLFASPAFAADFKSTTGNIFPVFDGLRNVAYILAAFGIAAFAVAAIFGKISFKWLGMIVVGLFILSYSKEFAEYVTGAPINTEIPAETPLDTEGNSGDGGMGDSSDLNDDPSNIDTSAGSVCSDSGTPTGALSAKFESGGDPAKIGYDKNGGWSYGKHQLASNTGAMGGYIEDLKSSSNPEHQALGAELEAAGGEAGAQAGTDDFKNKWAELSTNETFNASQQKYFAKTYYDPVQEGLNEDIPGLNLDDRHPAVKESVYSTSIQFGPAGGARVYENALEGKDVANMSDADIISAVQDYKAKNNDTLFASSTSAVRESTLNRAANEEATALKMLEEDCGSTT